MNLLQIFFIISWFLLVLIWYDFLKERKLSVFQIFVLVVSGFALIIFTVYPTSLHYFWQLFWISRWAYVLVYLSIIFLIYMLINVLNKIEINDINLTALIRNLAIENSDKKEIKGKEVFVIPAYNEWDVIFETLKNVLDNWYKNIVVTYSPR